MAIPVGVGLAIGAGVVGAASSIAGHAGQEKASRENRRLALQARRDAWRQLGIRQQQEIDASSLSLFQLARQVAASQALATVSAGEAGVEGLSVDLLLGDFERTLGEAKTIEGRNLEAILLQLQQEKRAQGALAQSRIAQVPMPSAWATVLQATGALIGAGAQAASYYPR